MKIFINHIIKKKSAISHTCIESCHTGLHTKSVPKSIHRIVTVPNGSGTSAKMKSKKGVISGMLLVKV